MAGAALNIVDAITDPLSDLTAFPAPHLPMCIHCTVSKSRVGIAGIVVIAGAALSSACSSSASVGTPEVPQSTVQSQVARQLAAAAQQAAPTVRCPGGLKASVGATLDCTLMPKGETTTFPVHVTVTSVKGGTAHFHVQVGQAVGAGDKQAFCADNVKLSQATAGAQQPSDLVPIFKANQSLLNDFQAKAPAAIVSQAGILVLAANHAISSGDASAFTTATVEKAGKKVDAYCGQNADGSTSTTG
jgi:hypothetical protein